MDNAESEILEGGCTCGAVRYLMNSKPMFVHCCHCTWCQRETGSAFALNAMIESDRVELLEGQPEVIDTPSLSGKRQKIARCPQCYVALWSNYSGAGDGIRFVRVGTLDQSERISPDVHIYISTKFPWVELPGDIAAFDEFYKPREQWPEESRERFRVAKSQGKA